MVSGLKGRVLLGGLLGFFLTSVIAIGMTISSAWAIPAVVGFPDAGAIEEFDFSNVIIVPGSGVGLVSEVRELADKIQAKIKSRPWLKRDSEVTPSDKDGKNLILIGAPEANTVLKSVYRGAPPGLKKILESPGQAVIGVYFNPFLGSDKDVLVVAGSDESGTQAAVNALTEIVSGARRASSLSLPPPVKGQALKFAHTQGVPTADLYVLFEKNFIQEEFRYYNAKVERVGMPGGGMIIEAMAAGEIQGGMFGTGPPILVANARGVLITFYAGWVYSSCPENPYDVIMTVPKANLKSLRDLKGKKVGVVTYLSLGHLQILEALDQEGLARDAVEFYEIPFPAMIPALDSGRIAAAYQLPSLFLLAKMKIGAISLVWDCEIRKGDLLVAGYVFNSKMARERPELLNAYLKAIVKAVRWTEEHLPEAVTIMTDPKNTPMTPPMVEMLKPMIFQLRDGEIKTDYFRKDVELSARFGFLPEKVDKQQLLSQIVDPGPIRKVWDELGITEPKFWAPWKLSQPEPKR